MARAPQADLAVTAETRLRAGPRRPSQERGAARYASLVDATEQLLNAHDPENIGHYQIAEAAGVSATSVYHFFPTREAAFLALAERYLERLRHLGDEPVPAADLRSWQDVLRISERRAAKFFNDNPPAMKIFLGGYGSLQGWRSDPRFSAGITDHNWSLCENAFYIPFFENRQTRLLIHMSILDAIWAISYQLHGRIEEEYVADASAARVAHFRLYLPEVVRRRPWIAEAAARGDMVVLTRPPAQTD